MTDARRAAASPAILDLEPRLYFWCACGRTATDPWCDGAHRGTGLQPVPLDLCARARCAICRCRRTRTPPRCDGSHREGGLAPDIHGPS